MVQNYLRTYQSDQVNGIWHELEPLIKKVLKKHEKDYSIESIKESLLKKELQLWTSYSEQIDAFILTHIAIYPNHKILEIFMCGGSGLDKWLHLLPYIEQWARDIECKYIRFQGRKGWERKLSQYKKTKIIMERAL